MSDSAPEPRPVTTEAVPLGTGTRRWLFHPPRRHGEVDTSRSVSFLELFYDLVYVVLIGQAAHTLAEDISWRGAATFAVIFGLIWIAWLNGTLFYELHGREDGHTRSLIFVQMLLLCLMAVYVGHADSDDGRVLAALYALLLALLSYQWYSVYRLDLPELRRTPRRYLIVMVAGIIVTAASVPLSADVRLAVWAVFVVAWCGVEFVILIFWRRRPSYDVVTETMVERFGLFIIIVLGEVVIGVVNGLTDTERSALVTTTGLLGLAIGFGFWWNYADLVSRRLPRETGHYLATWIFTHLPMAMAVAAGGAGMVGLVEHATDHRTPVAVSWLMGGSVAVMLLTTVVVLPTLEDYDRYPSAYKSVQVALVAAAVAALLAGWSRPAPWLLALTLLLVLFATWAFAFVRWLRQGSLINERSAESR
ncbi:low temperature requirement protein A [Streptomyces ferrugineus]|uniref:Low temperature requirement protein A n=1 Tax=Streptomyces ferrugineus TaxID=1413221 RepID=A0A7M2SAN7_9ACTN|nr:low temperature requirement protein A [Streptomyces ferrugineus]QOV33366.1 low temperature requirement protein A [Streptomyces ferrugineus]